jgi:hypothetical protein
MGGYGGGSGGGRRCGDGLAFVFWQRLGAVTIAGSIGAGAGLRGFVVVGGGAAARLSAPPAFGSGTDPLGARFAALALPRSRFA